MIAVPTPSYRKDAVMDKLATTATDIHGQAMALSTDISILQGLIELAQDQAITIPNRKLVAVLDAAKQRVDQIMTMDVADRGRGLMSSKAGPLTPLEAALLCYFRKLPRRWQVWAVRRLRRTIRCPSR